MFGTSNWCANQKVCANGNFNSTQLKLRLGSWRSPERELSQLVGHGLERVQDFDRIASVILAKNGFRVVGRTLLEHLLSGNEGIHAP